MTNKMTTMRSMKISKVDIRGDHKITANTDYEKCDNESKSDGDGAGDPL